MILENAKPRLVEAIEKANSTKTNQEVAFIYNELLTHDTITSVFDWLFRKCVDFATRQDEFRFVVIVFPSPTGTITVPLEDNLCVVCKTEVAVDKGRCTTCNYVCP